MSTNVPILDDAIARLMLIDQASVLAIADIAIERLRQIEGENWLPDHDDRHASGELSMAGGCYALAAHTPNGTPHPAPASWPWEVAWWKPASKHRNCVRGAALIVAELARHLRSAAVMSASAKASKPHGLDRNHRIARHYRTRP